VLVTVVPANTAKEVAVPNPTEGWAADAADVPATKHKTTTAAVLPTANQGRTQPARAKRITDVTKFHPSEHVPPRRSARG
jgi:hypothetical protein